jgi:hypothetical protein
MERGPVLRRGLKCGVCRKDGRFREKGHELGGRIFGNDQRQNIRAIGKIRDENKVRILGASARVVIRRESAAALRLWSSPIVTRSASSSDWRVRSVTAQITSPNLRSRPISSIKVISLAQKRLRPFDNYN